MSPPSSTTYAVSGRTWLRAGLYAMAILAVFAGVGAWLATNQDGLRLAVIDFFLPPDLHFVGDALIAKFLAPQHKAVLINALVTGSVVLVSMLTFPLKEWLSASYERDTRVTGARTAHPPPLWEQALEEIKLLLFYAAMTLLVLRIGQVPDPAFRTGALVLSNLVLAVTVAIDFASPTLARHAIRYADIVRALASRPLRSLAFGALFAAPPVVTGLLLVKLKIDPRTGFMLLAAVQTVTIVLAVLVGTIVGGTLLDRAEEATPVGPGLRLAGWVAALGLLAVNGLFFGAAGKALYHVSPVLKCEWSMVPDSFDLDTPSLLDPKLSLRLDVRIHNPTTRLVKVGDNRVEARHKADLLATTALPHFEVPPGGTAHQKLHFEVKPAGGLLAAGIKGVVKMKDEGILDTLKGAADPDAYTVRLVLPTPSGEFTIPLYAPKAKSAAPASK